MAYVIGGKHFGQYTYEHWFDHEYKDFTDKAPIESSCAECEQFPCDTLKKHGDNGARIENCRKIGSTNDAN